MSNFKFKEGDEVVFVVPRRIAKYYSSEHYYGIVADETYRAEFDRVRVHVRLEDIKVKFVDECDLVLSEVFNSPLFAALK